MSRDIGIVVVLAGLLIPTVFVYVLAVQWAWNVLTPALWGWPTIDFPQAAALGFVLAVIGGVSKR